MKKGTFTICNSFRTFKLMAGFELCYVWINDFNNLQEEGFSFTGKYTFTYNKEKGQIHTTVNSLYQPAFFMPTNWEKGNGVVTSVTALIGENGSGKSSIIEFFCNLLKLSDDGAANTVGDNLLIFEHQHRFFIYCGQKVRRVNLKKGVNEFNIFLDSTDEEFEYNFDSSFSHQLISMLYSTTWIDKVTHSDAKEWELINLSNSYFFYHGHFPPIVSDHYRNNSYVMIDYPNRHLSEDTKRQIFFLSEYKDWVKEEFDLRLCENVGLSIVQKFTTQTPTFINLFKILFERYTPENSADFAKLLFSSASIHSYVFTSSNNPNSPASGRNFTEELKNSIKENSLCNALTEFLTDHPFNIVPEKQSIMGSTIKLNDYKVPETIKLLKFIDKHFKLENFSFNKKQKDQLTDYKKNNFFNHIPFKINFDVTASFLELYLNHLESAVTPDYLHFETLEYSSGELSLLNLFSRIPHAQNHVMKDFERFNRVRWTQTNDIILWIDEGESYLHPQWQKKLLGRLIGFITEVLKGKFVQIIITSHSPIFISDLPKENIVFLRRDKLTGTGKNVSDEIKLQTFGSNIYSLYSDSFFINDGMIGDFAKGKISFITKRLADRRRLTEDEASYLKNNIELIGEPVWKLKLTEMLNKKLSNKNV